MYHDARAREYLNFPLGENGHRTDAPLANPVLKYIVIVIVIDFIGHLLIIDLYPYRYVYISTRNSYYMYS